jgi:tRNA-dihydrouridine synthase 2
MGNIWKDGPKLILAPMVRIGTLPLRLLALKYGADVVFSPEIVDKSIIGTLRVFNRELNVIEYRQRGDGDKIIFRCSPIEKGKLVIQIGSNDPERALAAARILQEDASGIDLNCGCPKHFSTHSGMGAALLENPMLLCSILKKLVCNIRDIPISAKIRLLPGNIELTKQLVREIISTGISALSIHGRTRFQTYDEPSDWDKIKTLVDFIRNELKNETIAINLCGDIFSFKDVHRAFEQIGVNGIMFARAAQWNVSVFSSHQSPPHDLLKIIHEYLETCISIDNHPSNSKFAIIEMLVKEPQKYNPQLLAVYKCKSNKDLAQVFSLPFYKLEKNLLNEPKSIEDVEFGYSRERQEIQLFNRLEKLFPVDNTFPL